MTKTKTDNKKLKPYIVMNSSCEEAFWLDAASPEDAITEYLEEMPEQRHETEFNVIQGETETYLMTLTKKFTKI